MSLISALFISSRLMTDRDTQDTSSTVVDVFGCKRGNRSGLVVAMETAIITIQKKWMLLVTGSVLSLHFPGQLMAAGIMGRGKVNASEAAPD